MEETNQTSAEAVSYQALRDSYQAQFTRYQATFSEYEGIRGQLKQSLGQLGSLFQGISEKRSEYLSALTEFQAVKNDYNQMLIRLETAKAEQARALKVSAQAENLVAEKQNLLHQADEQLEQFNQENQKQLWAYQNLEKEIEAGEQILSGRGRGHESLHALLELHEKNRDEKQAALEKIEHRYRYLSLLKTKSETSEAEFEKVKSNQDLAEQELQTAQEEKLAFEREAAVQEAAYYFALPVYLDMEERYHAYQANHEKQKDAPFSKAAFDEVTQTFERLKHEVAEKKHKTQEAQQGLKSSRQMIAKLSTFKTVLKSREQLLKQERAQSAKNYQMIAAEYEVLKPQYELLSKECETAEAEVQATQAQIDRQNEIYKETEVNISSAREKLAHFEEQLEDIKKSLKSAQADKVAAEKEVSLAEEVLKQSELLVAEKEAVIGQSRVRLDQIYQEGEAKYRALQEQYGSWLEKAQVYSKSCETLDGFYATLAQWLKGLKEQYQALAAIYQECLDKGIAEGYQLPEAPQELGNRPALLEQLDEPIKIVKQH